MAGSGFAGLAYQVVWTQQGGLWLGHESAAVFAVIGAFFGGLAAGAFLLGTRIEASRYPVRWYAACEACIGAWAVALVVLAEPAAVSLRELSGHDPSPVRQWLTAFLGLFIVLLPATAAMGATLPAMARILAPSPRSSRSVASLYAANTAGAVAGVLAGAFWLVPEIGLSRTTLACAGLNFVVALLAVRALPEPARQPIRAIRGHASLTPLAMTGLLGIGYEVLAVRALAQVAENTVYTFAVLLAVYLVGTAAGASVWAWLAARDEAVTRWRERLLLGLCATTLLGLFVLAAAPAIKRSLLASLGPGFTPALLAEALLALAAFALPTMLMGALFSLLADEARSRGEGLGRAIAANTLGAAFAAPVFGVALVPLGGTAFAFVILAAGYLALAATRFSPAFAATALATLAVAIWGPSLRLVDVAPGAHVVEYREGVLAAVSVIEDASGVRRLHINNRQQEAAARPGSPTGARPCCRSCFTPSRTVPSSSAWAPASRPPSPPPNPGSSSRRSSCCRKWWRFRRASEMRTRPDRPMRACRCAWRTPAVSSARRRSATT